VIVAWRIVKTKYSATAFTGDGASLEGGRWNSPGTSLVYVSSSASLALLETLVNLESIAPLPAYSLVRIEFEEVLVERLREDAVPANWLAYPAPAETQQIGDLWVASARSCILAVPSTIIPHELNYLINPSHPSFGTISIGPAEVLQIDARIRDLIRSA
jgi:RES domain-containing protein